MALRLLLLVLAARSVAAATAPPPSLTTAFVPSPLCTIDIYNVADATAACVAGTAAVVCQYFQLGVTAPTSDCFPSGFDPSSTAFFSPGLACPSGYATACSSVASLASGGRETRATCCPSYVAAFLCLPAWLLAPLLASLLASLLALPFPPLPPPLSRASFLALGLSFRLSLTEAQPSFPSNEQILQLPDGHRLPLVHDRPVRLRRARDRHLRLYQQRAGRRLCHVHGHGRRPGRHQRLRRPDPVPVDRLGRRDILPGHHIRHPGQQPLAIHRGVRYGTGGCIAHRRRRFGWALDRRQSRHRCRRRRCRPSRRGRLGSLLLAPPQAESGLRGAAGLHATCTTRRG